MFEKDVLANIIETAGKSLVRVDAGHRWNATGTAWSEDGLIVTTDHVVERDEGTVTLPDGTTVTATVVGRDPGTDVAVLRVAQKLVPATFRSTDGLRVGQFVATTARPGKTVRASFGIVSTFGDGFRTQSGGKIDRWLEADAAMPPGYSGGLLLDMEGKALGLNSRGLVRHSHLTIPHATLARVVTEIVQHGKVRRGYLGVGVQPARLSEANAKLASQEKAVLVHAVEPGSPADKGGIEMGDVILTIDGSAIDSPWELVNTLRDKHGAEAAVRILRAGQVSERKVTIASR